jgi:hypothetical protein
MFKKEEARKIYRERLLTGLCPRCGRNPVDGNKQCKECILIGRSKNKKTKENRLKRLKNNLCISCGKNPPVDKYKNCNSCLDKYTITRHKRCSSFTQRGLCSYCSGKNKYLDSMKDRSTDFRFCLECYMKHCSYKNTGSPKYYKELLNMLEQTNYICPYTGDKIIIGINDSIDHILPSSKFPELSKDINNLHWVTRDANNMKLYHTEDEFKILIKKIHDHLKL